MCETKGSWTLCFMLMMGVAQGCMYHFFRPILLSAVAPLEGVAQTEFPVVAGIVHPKMIFHPFTSHHFVDSDSGNIY